MKRTKKERLEAAGFREGTVQEFLGLSDAEAEIVEMRVKALTRFEAAFIAGMLDDVPWNVPIDPDMKKTACSLLKKLESLLDRKIVKRLQDRIDQSP